MVSARGGVGKTGASADSVSVLLWPQQVATGYCYMKINEIGAR